MRDILIKTTKTNDYLTKSKLPNVDFVINPYLGCSHGCKYCYAVFVKRFAKHKEDWGTFVDAKLCPHELNVKKAIGKTLFISSVTDCYNEVEKDYKITRKILEQLINVDCTINISTKSDLVLRDIDILKKLHNVKVALSINTLDESFKEDMDYASNIKKRIEALRELHANGIYTVLFMSPIFPYITDFKAIIEATHDFVCEYWFENLNLRDSYKKVIMNYIKTKYPQHYADYVDIYDHNNLTYFEKLSSEIEDYCIKNAIKYVNYFYHEKLVTQ